jgi:mono/diheme cytochrome c family protein
MRLFTLVIAAAFYAGAAFAQDAATQGPAPQGSVETGKRLFTADGCYQCHGYSGQSAPGYAPRIAPKILPYPAFINQLRHPRADMPPYEATIVSDQQVADIYAFLKTQKDDDPQAAPSFY